MVRLPPKSPAYVVYDIETVPESEVADDWTDRVAPDGKEKFPPVWAHKIVSIAMARFDEHLRVIDSCAAPNNEEEAIDLFSQWVWSEGQPPCSIVDFNGRSFDMPVIQCRAFRYGIELPWYFGKSLDENGQVTKWTKPYRDRYSGKHIDLMDWFTNHRSFFVGLKPLARLMGLPGKSEMDGAGVHAAWTAGRQSDIDKYCLEDVYHTAFLYMRMRLLTGGVFLHYCDAAEALLEHIEQTGNHTQFLKAVNEEALLFPKRPRTTLKT